MRSILDMIKYLPYHDKNMQIQIIFIQLIMILYSDNIYHEIYI